jgi:hypothetical protein
MVALPTPGRERVLQIGGMFFGTAVCVRDKPLACKTKRTSRNKGRHYNFRAWSEFGPVLPELRGSRLIRSHDQKHGLHAAIQQT